MRGDSFQPGLFGGEPRNQRATLPNMYLNDDLITRAERNFYRVLTRAVLDQSFLVFPQVSLWRLVHLPGTCASSRLRSQWENKIARRAVDFVVCDAVSFRPLMVIELDDASHQQADRQRKDRELHRVMSKIGLPLVRVPVMRSYRTRELRERIMPHLRPATEAA